ncbi:MAG: hypothetical protein KF778_19850 [Rhodocyclaceae bacterium]|nr:hypothetical protein [Rhodocyclaceae bacterium]MBX3670662.1 hypothetical protein [Rhodocyclaceae bacterium]
MEFPDYRWQRLALSLQCTFVHRARKAHPVSVLEAIVKGIGEAAGMAAPAQRSVFRWPFQRATRMQLAQGQTLDLEILLFGTDVAGALCWREQALRYFDPGAPGRNFRVVAAGLPREASFVDLLAGQGTQPESDEIALDFLTPLGFTRTPGYDRAWLDGPGLGRAMQHRLRRLFGAEPSLPPWPEVLPGYWKYCEIEHAARSQPGQKYLNGCVGPLLLRGANLADWWPWLRLFEQVGMGAQISFGQGLFRLHGASTPVLDPRLFDSNRIARVIERMAERHPELPGQLSAAGWPGDANACALAISRCLREGWPPRPARAAERPDGSTRQPESAAGADLVLHTHLAQLLGEALDRLVSTGSIGHRKDRMRADAADPVQAALAQGYTRVLEFELADIYPALDWARLEPRLDALLPRRDQHLRRTLSACLQSASSGGAGEPPAPARGLPPGSPLLPLLGQLCLDDFDRRLAAVAPGARIVRHAGHFTLLADKGGSAQALREQAGKAAAAAGLALEPGQKARRAPVDGSEYPGPPPVPSYQAHTEP